MGLRCGCSSRRQCTLCRHCIDHHVKNCTPELQEEAKKIENDARFALANLRDIYRINIFEIFRR